MAMPAATTVNTAADRRGCLSSTRPLHSRWHEPHWFDFPTRSLVLVSLILQPSYAGSYARGTAQPPAPRTALLGGGRPEPCRGEMVAARRPRDLLRQQALRSD